MAGSGGSVSEADYAQLRSLLGVACLRCGSDVAVQWDHIIPLSRKGPHHATNLQPLCRPCNEQKYARTADYRTDEQRSVVEQVWNLAFKRVEVPCGDAG